MPYEKDGIKGKIMNFDLDDSAKTCAVIFNKGVKESCLVKLEKSTYSIDKAVFNKVSRKPSLGYQ